MRFYVTRLSLRRHQLITTVLCSVLLSAVYAESAPITPPSKGYALYFNEKLITIPDAATLTRDDAQQNCAWNMKTKPHIAVQCFYDGEPLNSRPAAAAGSVGMNWNTERQGYSYYTFTLENADPSSCMNRCAQDARCKTWTYFKPNTARRNHAICVLRDHATPPMPSPHAVSGEK